MSDSQISAAPIIGTSSPDDQTSPRVAPERDLSQLLLLFFIWFLLVILTATSPATALDPKSLQSFAIVSICILMVSSGVVLLGASGKELLTLGFATYAIMLGAFCGLEFTEPQRTPLLELFLILSVTLPALLQIWTRTFQFSASFLCIATALWTWRASPGTSGALSITLVSASAGIAAAVSYFQRPQSNANTNSEIELESRRVISQIERTQLLRRVWSVVMLQADLLIVLVFLDILLRGEVLSQRFLGNIYAMVFLVFVSMFLTIIRPRAVAPFFWASTCVLLAVVSYAGMSVENSQLLQSTLPIIYLTFTTIALPWSFSYQILLAWCAVLSAVLVRLFFWWTPGLSFPELVSQHPEGLRAEVFVICCGAFLSVFIARVLRQHHWSHIPQIVGRDDETSVAESSLIQKVPVSVRESLGIARRRRLVWSSLGLGMYTSSTATIVLWLHLREAILWSIAVWILSAAIWGALYYLFQKEKDSERFWRFGAFGTLLQILVLVVLLIAVRTAAQLWVLWPGAVIIGIGAIPWSLTELIPIFGSASIVALALVDQLRLGAESIFVLVAAAILSLLLNAQLKRRLREKYLVTNFHSTINWAETEIEAMRLLADALNRLFHAQGAVVSTSVTHLELVRSGRSYLLAPDDWPMSQVANDYANPERDDRGVGISIVQSLPSRTQIFDRRFGVFSPNYGLLLEIPVGDFSGHWVNPSDSGNQSKTRNAPDFRRLRIFIGTAIPVMKRLQESELQLARALATVTILRTEHFMYSRYQVQREQAYEASQSEREYELSTLVHDINNTVQDLSLLCDSAFEELEGPEAASGKLAQQIKRISVMSRSLATVVSDAKRKRELERLHDLTPRELINVTDIVSEIAVFAEIRAERKRITVSLEQSTQEAVWVKISAREHLETVLRNLLNNATMYSDPGSKIRIVVREENGLVALDVIDNGPGLSTEECKSVFLSGYRGRSGQNVRGGLGLGLAQSRRVLEAANGVLEVFSAGAGQGSTFTVKLPKCAAPTSMASAKSWALMVDDQPNLTEFYAKIARALNFAPVIASSVHEAIAMVQERGKPSFVLTDLHLGSTDGLDLVRFLRGQFGLHLPILVVSGMNDDNVEERVRKAGATDFVAKPIARSALFARIQSLLPSDRFE